MNILLACETSGPGGAEIAVLNLGQAMVRRGHRCLVAVPAQGWVSESAAARGLSWVCYLGDRKGGRWEAVRGLWRIVREFRADLIHAHMFDAAVYAALVAVLSGTPMIATIHGHADLKGSRRTIATKFTILRLWARRVVFVSGELERRVLEEIPVIRPKAMAIPNGIPIDGAGNWEPRHGAVSVGTFTFGALGNIRPPKGYGVLLDAVAIACLEEPGIRLRIAGEPDRAGLYEQLLARRAKLKLEDRVEFLGHVSDVRGFLDGLDGVVSSSLSEGLPLSLMEAMAHGLPVVATRCGGIPELIEHDVHGLLCEPGNAQELAAAMMRMVRDPISAHRLGKAARERAQTRFSLDAMCDSYERLYRAAVGHADQR